MSGCHYYRMCNATAADDGDKIGSSCLPLAAMLGEVSLPNKEARTHQSVLGIAAFWFKDVIAFKFAVTFSKMNVYKILQMECSVTKWDCI